MDESKAMAELADNVKSNFAQLQELFKAYDLAKLGYDMQEQDCNEAHNRVLAANVFVATEDCKRAGIKAGERITDETFTFLLSEDDFNRYLELSTVETAKAGITDEKGYYLEDWTGLKIASRRELVAFIIDTILPFEMQLIFKPYELNIVQTDKLLNIMRPIVCKTESKTA